MDDHAATAYQHASAGGASPIGIIVALYDTILRDFRRALAALAASDVETRVFELNHALTVVAHLRAVLDHKRGKEAAARFEHLYEVTRAMIMDANVNPSQQALEKLIGMYSSVRMAWYQAEQGVIPATPKILQSASATEVSRAAMSPAVGAASDDADSKRASWRA